MPVEWSGAAAENYRKGRCGFEPKAIVIHIIVGSLESARLTFGDPRASISAHYGVGKAESFTSVWKKATRPFSRHCGAAHPALIVPKVNPNYYTIGIEHEGQP